jgi:hypothetical protein
MRHPVRERVGLAGSGPGDDEERAGYARPALTRLAVSRSGTLLGVEVVEPVPLRLRCYVIPV